MDDKNQSIKKNNQCLKLFSSRAAPVKSVSKKELVDYIKRLSK